MYHCYFLSVVVLTLADIRSTHFGVSYTYAALSSLAVNQQCCNWFWENCCHNSQALLQSNKTHFERKKFTHIQLSKFGKCDHIQNDRGCTKKNAQTFYFIPQKWLILESKVKLNNGSRVLKWGIVHLCSSITFGDTTSFIENWVFKICIFVKSAEIIMQSCQKCENFNKLHILFLIIALRPFKLQRCTIPHFKTLDLFF